MLGGWPHRLGTLTEGTPAAKLALEHYAQTRDEVFYEEEPDEARTEAALTLLKTGAETYYPGATFDPAVNPPRPWLYEYAWPDDSIKILSIRPATIARIDWSPEAISYKVSGPGQTRTVLTNEPDAIASYVQRLLDPGEWFPNTVSKVVVVLAKKFGPLMKELSDLTEPHTQPEPDNGDAAPRRSEQSA